MLLLSIQLFPWIKKVPKGNPNPGFVLVELCFELHIKINQFLEAQTLLMEILNPDNGISGHYNIIKIVNLGF